jgi:glycine/D-amino acid oxidase-like deaminating enzyme
VIQRPYWWDTVVRGQVAEHDAVPRSCDVLVIGAGYTGLAAARRLASRGASVLVVDSEGVGWGASSRNGGQLLTGLKVDPATLIARYGERDARALFDAANRAIANTASLIAGEKIECELRHCGHIQAAWKKSHFRMLQDEQALLARVFDHRVEIVPPSEQHRELGSGCYHGLLVDEKSGCLNPAQYVYGLAQAARRKGACIFNRVRVQAMARIPGGWRVSTTRGEIDASNVLVATNGYTDGAAPAVQRRFVPIGSFIIATEPLEHDVAAGLLPNRRVVFDSKHFLYYFRLTGDRRLLFGGRAEFRRASDASIARAADILRRGMVTVFPILSGVRVDYAWGGHVAFTRDLMPHGGAIDGLFYAGGYCGHGVAIATEFGDLIARRMCGETVDNPLLDVECPTIPLYRGTPWFLPLAGAYYKVLDWIT